MTGVASCNGRALPPLATAAACTARARGRLWAGREVLTGAHDPRRDAIVTGAQKLVGSGWPWVPGGEMKRGRWGSEKGLRRCGSPCLYNNGLGQPHSTTHRQERRGATHRAHGRGAWLTQRISCARLRWRSRRTAPPSHRGSTRPWPPQSRCSELIRAHHVLVCEFAAFRERGGPGHEAARPCGPSPLGPTPRLCLETACL